MMKTKPIIAALLVALMLAGCGHEDKPTAQTEPVQLILSAECQAMAYEVPTSMPVPEKALERVYRDIPLSKKLQDDVQDACDEFGVPEDLLYAVMSAESGYKVDAVNGKCVGLMQIHEINYPWLVDQIGIVSLDNPTDNIRSGAYILGGYLQKYDVVDSLMAYSMGESGPKKLWRAGTHETLYTSKVLYRMKGV